MFRKPPRFFDLEQKVLSFSSRPVTSCRETDSIKKVIGVMLNGYRKIPVTGRKGLSGIVTVLDVLNYCGAGEKYEIFEKEAPLDVPVGKIMAQGVVSIPHTASLQKTLEVFRQYKRGSYPVVQKGRVVGMIADWDFVKRISSPLRVKVGDAMSVRPAQARESYSISDVAKMMVRGGYRRLPVTKSGVLRGIVVPFDILSFLNGKGALASLKEQNGPIAPVVRKKLVTISPQEDLGKAARIMASLKLGGLPVVEEGELVGIITESDIVQGLV